MDTTTTLTFQPGQRVKKQKNHFVAGNAFTGTKDQCREVTVYGTVTASGKWITIEKNSRWYCHNATRVPVTERGWTAY